MLFKKIILLVISTFVFLSCVEEDPDLVNPPPQSASIKVRLINFGGDKNERKLSLDGKIQTSSVVYGECSDAIEPPADSSYPSILLNGSEEYRSPRKIRFQRNNHYTVFAFPSMPIDTIPYKPVDTVIVASTLANLYLREGYTYLRMINAVRDSNRSYQLRLGCPNGAMIGSVGYTKTSAQTEVLSDGVSVSILKTDNGKTDLVGLFNLNLEEMKQYMLVIASDGGNGEKIFLLNELSEKASYFEIFPESIEGLSSQIRCINLSIAEQSFFKAPDKFLTNGIITNVISKSISSMKSVQACNEGGALDTLAIFKGQDTVSKIYTSLNISEKYSLFAIDSGGVSGGSLLLAQPYRMDYKNKAIVRVVHAAHGRPQLTISVAANSYSDTDDSLGYRAGDLIAQKIPAGTISEPIRVVPGENIPITVFTSSEPAVLEYTAIANLESNKKYLLIVDYDDKIKDYKLYLIDETDESEKQLSALPKGVFAQFVNLVPGLKISYFSIPSVLNNVKLYYGASISTVLSEGAHNMKINGRDTTINANLSERIMIIFAGKKDTTDILVHNSKPSSVGSKVYYRRFVNACKEIPLLNVKLNKDDVDTAPTIEGLVYGNSTKYQEINLGINLSLFFIDYKENKTIYQVDDMQFPFAKKYTIIFGGMAKDSSYSVVVQQEY